MKSYMGIDVGKHQLEIYHAGRHFGFGNTKVGIKKLLTYLQRQADKGQTIFVVFEATGGYERVLRSALQKEDYTYHLAHPNKVRAFAKAKGLLAKTDAIDAKLIALYAEYMKVTANVSEKNQAMKLLLKRRTQLIAERNQETNRLDKEILNIVKRSIQKHVRWLNKEIAAIETALKQASEQAACEEQLKLLISIPGIGELTAYTLLAYMPEITTANRGQLAALAGVAPMNRDSGSFQGKRFIQGGRAPLRCTLYMASISAIRYNPDMKIFYERLRQKGKSTKVALVAVMRKLLLMASSVLKRGTPWQVEYTPISGIQSAP